MTNQQQRILALLRSRPNEWISLPEILMLGCAQYNARIHELRSLGHKIENKTQEVEGVRYSWYMLVLPELQPRQLVGFGVKVTTNAHLIA